MIAGVLAVLLVARKLLDRLWVRYRKRKSDWIELLIDSHSSLDPFRKFHSVERVLLKSLVQTKAESANDDGLNRLTAIYEAAGLADRQIRVLHRSLFWWKRAEAAHQLGQMGIRRARADLVGALKDPHTEVRLEATWALGRMKFIDELPRIVESMSGFFKIAALRMDAFIFDMGEPALPVLLDLCRHSDEHIRMLAIHLVGEFKNEASLPVLIPELLSPNMEIRLATMKALGTIGNATALHKLIPCLTDDAWQVRAQAAKQLGRNRFKFAIPSMMKGMEDRAWWVRQNTGEAFSLMGEEGEAALQVSLQSADRFARDMATQWLDEMEATA